MISYSIFLLVAQIAIALALFAATSWYAYFTMKLWLQQRKSYLLSKEIWERQSTPKVWFDLTRSGTSKVHLIAVNLGGDVAVNVETTITTKIGKLFWERPCILPRDQVNIDLPDEISYATNSDILGEFQIKCEYTDSIYRNYETAQTLKLELKEGTKSTCQDVQETDNGQSESKKGEMQL